MKKWFLSSHPRVVCPNQLTARCCEDVKCFTLMQLNSPHNPPFPISWYSSYFSLEFREITSYKISIAASCRLSSCIRRTTSVLVENAMKTAKITSFAAPFALTSLKFYSHEFQHPECWGSIVMETLLFLEFIISLLIDY